MIRGVKRSGARIAIINGRFHERAPPRYRWFYRLIGNPFKNVDLPGMTLENPSVHGYRTRCTVSMHTVV